MLEENAVLTNDDIHGTCHYAIWNKRLVSDTESDLDYQKCYEHLGLPHSNLLDRYDCWYMICHMISIPVKLPYSLCYKRICLTIYKMILYQIIQYIIWNKKWGHIILLLYWFMIWCNTISYYTTSYWIQWNSIESYNMK